VTRPRGAAGARSPGPPVHGVRLKDGRAKQTARRLSGWLASFPWRRRPPPSAVAARLPPDPGADAGPTVQLRPSGQRTAPSLSPGRRYPLFLSHLYGAATWWGVKAATRSPPSTPLAALVSSFPPRAPPSPVLFLCVLFCAGTLSNPDLHTTSIHEA